MKNTVVDKTTEQAPTKRFSWKVRLLSVAFVAVLFLIHFLLWGATDLGFFSYIGPLAYYETPIEAYNRHLSFDERESVKQIGFYQFDEETGLFLEMFRKKIWMMWLFLKVILN